MKSKLYAPLERQGRRVLGACAMLTVASAAILASGFAAANDYPTRPIRMIVSFPAGGSTDVVARLLAKEMSVTLGQQVVVDNRAGASGAIGTDAIAKAQPDGYTIGYLTTGSTVILPQIDPKLSYNVARDIVPVSQVVRQPFVVVVRKDLNVNTLKELVALAKANPKKITFGSPGVATPSHLTGELLKETAGIDLMHVAYRGDQPAITDLLGGQIDAMMLSALSVKPLAVSGKIKPLAVSARTRLSELPDVPTVEELGYPGFSTHNFHGVFAPAGTPPAVLERIQRAVVAALQTRELSDRITREGLIVVGSTPAEFTAEMKEETRKWGAVVKKVSVTRE